MAITRRDFLRTLAIGAAATALKPQRARAQAGIQDVNFDDTPVSTLNLKDDKIRTKAIAAINTFLNNADKDPDFDPNSNTYKRNVGLIYNLDKYAVILPEGTASHAEVIRAMSTKELDELAKTYPEYAAHAFARRAKIWYENEKQGKIRGARGMHPSEKFFLDVLKNAHTHEVVSYIDDQTKVDMPTYHAQLSAEVNDIKHKDRYTRYLARTIFLANVLTKAQKLPQLDIDQMRATLARIKKAHTELETQLEDNRNVTEIIQDKIASARTLAASIEIPEKLPDSDPYKRKLVVQLSALIDAQDEIAQGAKKIKPDLRARIEELKTNTEKLVFQAKLGEPGAHEREILDAMYDVRTRSLALADRMKPEKSYRVKGLANLIDLHTAAARLRRAPQIIEPTKKDKIDSLFGPARHPFEPIE